MSDVKWWEGSETKGENEQDLKYKTQKNTEMKKNWSVLISSEDR